MERRELTHSIWQCATCTAHGVNLEEKYTVSRDEAIDHANTLQHCVELILKTVVIFDARHHFQVGTNYRPKA